MSIEIEPSVEMLFMRCESCESQRKCMQYDPTKEKRSCPIERSVYQAKFRNIVEHKGVDPELYYEDIKELCILYFQYWRRSFFEASYGIAASEGMRTSAEANKIANTILKKEKSLGIDRFTQKKKMPLKEIPGEVTQGDVTTIFNKINMIVVGNVKMKDEKETQEIIVQKNKRIKSETKTHSKKRIKFEDLKTADFGFPEIKPIIEEDEESTEEKEPKQFPLMNVDKGSKRYIPTR